MSIGSQCRLFHSLDIVNHTRIAFKLGADHQAINKETNQVLDLGAVTASNGDTNTDIFLITVAAQQHLIGSHQHHKGCDIMLIAELIDRLRALFAQ